MKRGLLLLLIGLLTVLSRLGSFSKIDENWKEKLNVERNFTEIPRFLSGCDYL